MRFMQVEEIFLLAEKSHQQCLTELFVQRNQLLHKFVLGAGSIIPGSWREQGFQDHWE